LACNYDQEAVIAEREEIIEGEELTEEEAESDPIKEFEHISDIVLDPDASPWLSKFGNQNTDA
jgi:hypothetical protein